jgi:hypothetical protein
MFDTAHAGVCPANLFDDAILSVLVLSDFA